ncbi:MFS transporter [Oerskovia flava]|uniref:MFS transporter n=1 Tax=Oerskovia flava TaxID=2986422 RepID=UPI00224039DD|nr:MFS transporter [Oerskovia sp. JB1-3-2]
MRPLSVAYLSSYLLSMLGNAIAAVALPLIVLQVTGSVLGAGAVAAATAIPAFLAGLLMGVVIDRINRRTSSVVTDIVSGLAIAALPVIDMISGLSLGWFILFGVIGSIGDVPGLTARDALVPAIVRHGGITAERLIGLKESLGAVAMLLGPAAAGTLMVLFDGSTVLWITAGTSLAAALITMFIPRRVGEITTTSDLAAQDVAAGVPQATSGWSQLRDGWRVLLRSRFLVATTTISVIVAIVLAALQGLVLPVYFTMIDRPGMLGFVLTALAAGMLLGGGVYAVAGSRGRRRAWYLTGLAGSTVGFAMIAPLSSMWVVLAGAFVVGLFGGLFSSLMGVLMIERIPEDMRGRIMGTQNSIMTAATPVGIIVAAVVIESTSVQTAAIVISAVWLVALVVGLAARSLRTLERESEQTAEVETVGASSA